MTHMASQEYMLLMRGADWGKGLSPREAQDGLTAMMAWIDTLRQSGVLKAGQPLAPEGHVVSAGGGTLMDGPFVETKEAVGGYLLVEYPSLEDAKRAAMDCPVLKYGLVIEIRPVVPQCPLADELSIDMAGIGSSQ